jgi:hypothetical protein
MATNPRRRLAVVIVVVVCVPLTELLARTPLALPLTGRRRVPWRRPGPDATVPQETVPQEGPPLQLIPTVSS